MSSDARRPFGLYLHWPFCESKCPYCDFNSHVVTHVDQDAWKAGFLWDLERLWAETPDHILQTIYFGGGTPSLMSADLVGAILDKVAALWPRANSVEVTLEANPGSVEVGRFRGYRAAGVTRVSLGVQALNDADLRALGRLHSADEARRAISIAQSVFDRVSFDLIYARQAQGRAAWEKELTEALGFGTEHLSLYQLTLEDGTVFSRRYAQGKLHGLPDEDLSVDLFNLTQELTASAGLPAYEVSNHARPGWESQHNIGYWTGRDYLGVGPGAHGRITLNGTCWATEERRMPAAWLDAVSRETSPEVPRVPIAHEDRAEELLIMGLRLTDGLDRAEIERLRGRPLPEPKLRSLEADGMLAIKGPIIRATPQGRLLLNTVIREIVLG